MKTLYCPQEAVWIQHRLRTCFRVTLDEIRGQFNCSERTAHRHLANYRQTLGASEGPNIFATHSSSREYLAKLPSLLDRRNDARELPLINQRDLEGWASVGMIPKNSAEAMLRLDALRGHTLLANAFPDINMPCLPRHNISPDQSVFIEVTSSQTRMHLRGDTVAMVLQALFLQARFEFDYIKKDKGERRRWDVSPHRLVFANGRYHMRAYCHKADLAMDFNLARVHPDKVHQPNEYYGVECDKEWATPVMLKFEIYPSLTQEEREVVQETFSMETNVHSITTNQALAYYVRQQILGKTFVSMGENCLYKPFFRELR